MTPGRGALPHVGLVMSLVALPKTFARGRGSLRLPHVGLVMSLVALLAVAAARPAAAEDLRAARASVARPDPSRALPREITGTLRLNGCTVAPTGLRLRAEPLGVRASTGRRLPADPRADTRLARFSGTGDPHLYRFSIRGLQPATLYRLGIDAPPNPVCGKIFWRGPFEGLAVPGGPPVRIEGFAARTEVEILDLRSGEWLGVSHLQLADPVAAVRTLRWRSSLRGVVAGELQVSTQAFPHRRAFRACDEPAGAVIHRRFVPAQPGRWVTLDAVDFREILDVGRTPPPDGGRSAEDAGPLPDGSPAMTDATRGRVLAGAPLYLRVVPVTARGPACDVRRDGVHGWAIVAKLAGEVLEASPAPPTLLQAGDGQAYAPPYIGPGQPPHPTYGELGFKVVKPHTVPPKSTLELLDAGDIWSAMYWQVTDPLGLALVDLGMVAPGTTLTPGMWFFLTPPSTGGGSSDPFAVLGSALEGFVTGLVGAFTGGLALLANLADDIKDALAEAVVDVATLVPGVEAGCKALESLGTSCEEVVKTGMDYGLTSLGVPPTDLFSLDPDQGVDYLASEIASAIESKTGLPAGFTEDQLKTIAKGTIDTIVAQQQGSNGPQYDWVIPYVGVDPAVWTLTVRKTDDEPLFTNVYVRTKSALYLQAHVHVPHVFPASNVLRIPVVLHPDTSGIPPPRCTLFHDGGVWCMPQLPLPGFPPPASALCQYESVTMGGTTLVPLDCASWNWDEIYYRNQWILQFEAQSCLNLWASSVWFSPGGIEFNYPLPPFVDFARVRPPIGAIWDGPAYIAPGCW